MARRIFNFHPLISPASRASIHFFLSVASSLKVRSEKNNKYMEINSHGVATIFEREILLSKDLDSCKNP